MLKKGICILSMVPVRSEASDKSEMTTQLIFGELFDVLESSPDGKWSRIKIEEDGYEGWVDQKQTMILKEQEYENLKGQKKYRTEEAISIVRFSKGEFLIPAGSTIYPDDQGKMKVVDEYWVHGKLAESEQKASADKVIRLANSYYNVPYLWGGKTHFGIDCSGLIQQVYGICGYQLPRDAWQQEQSGQAVSLESSRPGDLAFFKNDSGKIIHVGIVLEGRLILHASGFVRVDLLDHKGIFKREINDYSHFLASIKRIIV